ncbi:MAG: hypothetical protein ACXQTP_00360 [Candidatus Methanofastidiosia archaeon]
MDESAISGQLYGKYAVDIEGNIRGFVEDVDVEIKGGEIYFRLEMTQPSRVFKLGVVNKDTFGPKSRLTLTPKDIVSVGRDCIIIGFGKIPKLSEIERFKLVMAENEGLRSRYKESREEAEETLKNLRDREEENFEMKEKIKILKRKEEEFDLLRDELSRQKGELRIAREYIKAIEKLEEKISQLLQKKEG